MFCLGFKKTLYGFVQNLAVEAFECLGTLVLSKQLKFERYVFVDVFERFAFIALLINVMFLESFTNSFQFLLATKVKTKIHGILQTCRSQTQHHHKECENQQNNFRGETYSKRMVTLGGGMLQEQPKI
jgi:hypothetical protein